MELRTELETGNNDETIVLDEPTVLDEPSALDEPITLDESSGLDWIGELESATEIDPAIELDMAKDAEAELSTDEAEPKLLGIELLIAMLSDKEGEELAIFEDATEEDAKKEDTTELKLPKKPMLEAVLDADRVAELLLISSDDADGELLAKRSLDN
jgi:hypothetical protein